MKAEEGKGEAHTCKSVINKTAYLRIRNVSCHDMHMNGICMHLAYLSTCEDGRNV